MSTVTTTWEASPLIVTDVKPHRYKRNSEGVPFASIEVRQEIRRTKIYPRVSASNDMKDNPFVPSPQDQGQRHRYKPEVRVVWLLASPETTAELAQDTFDGLDDAFIYRTLSNEPIVDSDQLAAIADDSLDYSFDTLANNQVVRYGKNHPKGGQLILDLNGKIQYRRVDLSTEGKQDQDLRTLDLEDFYATKEILDELELGYRQPSQKQEDYILAAQMI